MKTALLADIQGNALALQTALNHIQQFSPDHIISLGDVVTGPHPKKVIQLLQAHNCLTVMGNMDVAILNPQVYQGDDESVRKYAEMDAWCFEQLSEADKSYLRAFQPTVTIPIDAGLHLLVCHGSPRSYDDVLVATTPDEELAPHFPTNINTILAVGHMHEALLRRFRNHWLINPGSIGLPHAYSNSGEKAKHPLMAEYAMLSVVNGHFRVDFHQLPYDGATFRREVLGSGMPHAAWFLTEWQV